MKTSKIVKIFSNTGRYLTSKEIFPFEICGTRHYSRSFKLVEENGCLVDENHYATNGRDQEVFDVPPGYATYHLTSGNLSGLIPQLPNDGQTWVTDDTVHGTWKIKKNQGIVLIRDPKHMDVLVTRHAALAQYLKEEGYVFESEITHVDDFRIIEGKKVAGILPMWLANLARTYTEVALDIPVELRGEELTIEQVREMVSGIHTYKVKRLDYEQ